MRRELFYDSDGMVRERGFEMIWVALIGFEYE